MDVGIQRRAKLFEVGEYPDKGVRVNRRDLLRLAANFDAPVPVLIEHGESPLELGRLISVDPVGDELFGTIQLTAEANALIDQCEAKSLSIGLAPDLSCIREVSLVRFPRVESARLFADSVGFSVGGWVDTIPSQAEHELRVLVREGKLLPAQLPFARALLGCSERVVFDGSTTSVRDVLLSMIRRQPAHGMLGTGPVTEMAAAEAGDSLMLPEEAAFYRRYFPNIPLAKIAQRR